MLEVLRIDYKYYSDALVKLYKLVILFELMLMKVTEYEVIHFLRFEETYN